MLEYYIITLLFVKMFAMSSELLADIRTCSYQIPWHYVFLRYFPITFFVAHVAYALGFGIKLDKEQSAINSEKKSN